MNVKSGSMNSLARQNFTQAAETALNKQINLEFFASYTYQAMAAYLGRDTVALPGLEKYTQECAEEERSHALKLINYMNKRGGIVVLTEIRAIESEWESAKNIMNKILELEKNVNASLLNLHVISGESNDPQLADFLESQFLAEQVKAIKEVSDMITQLERVGEKGLGLYLWDQELLETK